MPYNASLCRISKWPFSSVQWAWFASGGSTLWPSPAMGTLLPGAQGPHYGPPLPWAHCYRTQTAPGDLPGGPLSPGLATPGVHSHPQPLTLRSQPTSTHPLLRNGLTGIPAVSPPQSPLRGQARNKHRLAPALTVPAWATAGASSLACLFPGAVYTTTGEAKDHSLWL